MASARVLVVDDDPWILRMVTATLEKRHYVVETARDGKEALQKAQASTPDVVVTDVMMPVMDGWAFVQQLRTIPHLAALPVIFLTALGKDEERLRALGIRSEDYLSKPFRFEELETRVSEALARGPEAASSQVGQMPQQPQPPPGYPPQQPGYPHQPGYPQPGYPGYPQQGYPGYPQQGYPGYPQQGYPGYPQPGYPGYPQPGYPGYPQQQPMPGQPMPGQPGQMPPAHTPPQGQPTQPPPQQPEQPAPQQPAPQADAPQPGDSASASGSFPRGKRTTGLNGRIEQLGLSSLLVMMEMERKDGILALKDAATKATGRIFLRGGQVIHAKLDKELEVIPKESVYRMLTWQKGTFSFSAMEVDMEDTVQSSTTHLLMEGARLIDETNR